MADKQDKELGGMRDACWGLIIAGTVLLGIAVVLIILLELGIKLGG